MRDHVDNIAEVPSRNVVPKVCQPRLRFDKREIRDIFQNIFRQNTIRGDISNETSDEYRQRTLRIAQDNYGQQNTIRWGLDNTGDQHDMIIPNDNPLDGNQYRSDFDIVPQGNPANDKPQPILFKPPIEPPLEPFPQGGFVVPSGSGFNASLFEPSGASSASSFTDIFTNPSSEIQNLPQRNPIGALIIFTIDLIDTIVGAFAGRPKLEDTAQAAQRFGQSEDPYVRDFGLFLVRLTNSGNPLSSGDPAIRAWIGANFKKAVDGLVSEGYPRFLAFELMVNIMNSHSAASGLSIPKSFGDWLSKHLNFITTLVNHPYNPEYIKALEYIRLHYPRAYEEWLTKHQSSGAAKSGNVIAFRRKHMSTAKRLAKG